MSDKTVMTVTLEDMFHFTILSKWSVVSKIMFVVKERKLTTARKWAHYETTIIQNSIFNVSK